MQPLQVYTILQGQQKERYTLIRTMQDYLNKVGAINSEYPATVAAIRALLTEFYRQQDEQVEAYRSMN